MVERDFFGSLWMKEGVIIEPASRDWRGWRLFSQTQVDKLKSKTGRAK